MSRMMKDSNNIWIGCIPVEWDIFKIKRYCKEIFPGATPQSTNPDFWDGDINWIPSGSCHDSEIRTAPKTITQEGYNNSSTRLVPKNTALVAMTGATCGNTGFLLIDSCTNQSVTAYIEDKNICNSRYLWYVLQCSKEYLLSYKTGGAQSGINVENCKNIYVPLVPISEQIKISGYLDDKLQEINNIISKTQESIEEYKKLKQSIITQAVTKGVRGEREMKDSGIDWVGIIPKEWDVTRIKNIYSLRDEKNYKPLEEVNLISLYTDLGVVQHSDLDKTTGNKASNADGYKMVYNDDIVVNIILCWMGAIGKSDYFGVTSPAYDIYKPKDTVDSSFYHYYFRTNGFSGDCYKRGRGIMMMRWRTYSDQFRDINVVFPPLEEQKEIAEYIDEKIKEVDKIINKKELFISEMESFKKSLIYEYVTGKKEVV